MTRESAQLLLTLLDGQQMQVGAPDFAATVQLVLTAREELLAVLAQPAAGGD